MLIPPSDNERKIPNIPTNNLFFFLNSNLKNSKTLGNFFFYNNNKKNVR